MTPVNPAPSDDRRGDARDAATTIEPIATAVGKMRRVFGVKPALALGPDAPATATLRSGLAFEVTGPQGQAIATDMPAAAGGTQTAPTPGWHFRAAMAACTASVVQMLAAERGIALDRLAVTVDSDSDARHMLGMGGEPMKLRMSIRLAAANASESALREIAELAHRNSPVSSAVAAGDVGPLSITVEA